MTKRNFNDLSDVEENDYVLRNIKRRRIMNNTDSLNFVQYSDSDSDSDYDPAEDIVDDDSLSTTTTISPEGNGEKEDSIGEKENIVDNLYKKLLEALMLNKDNIPEVRKSITYLKTLSNIDDQKDDAISLLRELLKFLNNLSLQKPDLIKILELKINDELKYNLLNLVIDNLKKNSDNSKFKQWINTLIKFPFEKFKTPYPLGIEELQKKPDFFPNFLKSLNDAIYGQIPLKENLMEIVGKWVVNKNKKGNSLCILGDPGVGKTSIVKNGLSKALNLPFVNISLAGINDIGHISGFSYTYEGSLPGRITTGLIDSKCMNPIIFMDELDKIDINSSHGKTIINKLIELTDFTQNDSFEDRYFSGIKIDLSKCLFIFTANSLKKIDPILRDRLEIIKVDGYSVKEKIKIAKNYIIPEFDNSFNLKLNFSDVLIKYIIDKYSLGSGVRTLKRCFKTIYSKINMIRLTQGTSLKLSYNDYSKLTTINIDKLLKDINKAHDEEFPTSKPPFGLYL